MDGLWDCEALDDLIYRLLRADLEHRIKPLKLLLPVMWAKLVNLQSRNRAFRIGEHTCLDAYRLQQPFKRVTYRYVIVNNIDVWRHSRVSMGNVTRKLAPPESSLLALNWPPLASTRVS